MDAVAPDGSGNKPSPAEVTKQEQTWSAAVAQAAQAAKVAGKLSASMARLVKDALEPKVDWREPLRDLLTSLSKNDYAYSPPNKRYIHMGYYMPSLYSHSVPPIVLAVDTSCSITDEVIAGFQSEINCILEEVKPENVQVVYCDTSVKGVDTYTPDDFPIELEAKGGGGTSFQPVFDWLRDECEDEPACLIYLTDMYASYDLEDPGIPVIWADYDGSKRESPDFGDHIVIEE